jgi:hypothetical protein
MYHFHGKFSSKVCGAKELGRLLEQTNGEIVRRRLWEVLETLRAAFHILV